MLRLQYQDICLFDIDSIDYPYFELCKILKRKFLKPIIILTERDNETDIIAGFAAGADDYVIKPYSLIVLQSRILSHLRSTKRNDMQEQKCLLSDELFIDILHNNIICKGIPLPIGDTEFKLCLLLLENSGQILPKELFCFKKNWDEKERYVEDNTLSVHIARIRKKLGLYHGKPYIDTVKGIGYRWNIKVLEINCNKERQ